MKIARIFEAEGRFFVCDDAAPSLSTKGGAFASKAAAMREARAMGYTHARGSGTYKGNELTDLTKPGLGFSARKLAADRRRRAAARETHDQLDLPAAEE